MSPNKAIWTAKFVKRKRLGKTSPVRTRLFFKNLRNENEMDLIIKESFFIDESESIKGGRITPGDDVYFTADEDFENVEFCYPHTGDEKTYVKQVQEIVKGGAENEGSK